MAEQIERIRITDRQSEESRKRMTKGATLVGEKGRSAWKGVLERGDESWAPAQSIVRKYPGRSVGLALLGALNSLRDDH